MELDFVQWLADRLPPENRPGEGVGDDAVLLPLGGGQLVTAADLLIDGVHFSSQEHSPERIGRKALAVNLSDLAAMASRPTGFLLSLAVPRGGAGGLPPDRLARRLVEGMLPLAEEFGCPLVGGDTNVGPGPLVLAVTVFGEPGPRGSTLRSGARAGDALLVTGELGGSLAGKHLDFTPRVAEALRLVEATDVHAMIDLSDGLSLDLNRLCRASGVGARVEASRLPVSESLVDEPDAIERALSDGEDFELLLAVADTEKDRLLQSPPGGCRLFWIGNATEPTDVVLRRSGGAEEPLQPRGYEHR
ncbi:thiamine-phosphate kinase [Botrimarina sp.]|uniref:thiamine-phosphate kinase n=1 Tax=Botrimarina sp. TaxID=2795802 RepID=UPI0032EC7014